MDGTTHEAGTPRCPGCKERDERIARLEALAERQQRTIDHLRQRVDELQRQGKRQAAPFARKPPKPDPAKPGRKAGAEHGRHAHRPPPTPDRIDEHHDVPLPEECPSCGGEVEALDQARQYQVDLPRKPIHRCFHVQRGRCVRCRRRVRGRHTLQTSNAFGAASSQLGPDLQAAVVMANKQLGLSHGKVCRWLGEWLGIELSRGGACRVMQRVARRSEPAYEQIVEAMPRQPQVAADETGWRINGRSAWLHVMTSELLTCYRIAESRGFDVPAGVLGPGFGGVLIHDGWSCYDRFVAAGHQTCLAHLLRRCGSMLEVARGGAARFPRQVKALLLDALSLRDRHAAGEVSRHGLAVARGRLRRRLDRLLQWTRVHEPNERLAKHLHRHENQLFTFLDQPGVPATSWQAEQALRPAVVNRKVFGGNRTAAGAHAQEVLMSIHRTCDQQHRDPLTWLAHTLRGKPQPRLIA